MKVLIEGWKKKREEEEKPRIMMLDDIVAYETYKIITRRVIDREF